MTRGAFFMSIQYGVIYQFNESSLWGHIVHTVDGANPRHIEAVHAIDAAIAAIPSKTQAADFEPFARLIDQELLAGSIIKIDFHSTSFHAMPTRFPQVGDEVEVAINEDGRHFAIHLTNFAEFQRRFRSLNAVPSR